MKIKLGVIFGGETVEHEVSIISAVQAMGYLNEEKYEIIPIYISKNRNWYTGAMLKEIDIYSDFNNFKKYAKRVALIRKNGIVYLQSLGMIKNVVSEIDIILPIVHGNNVEDGSLQGYLDTLGIPYVGSNVLGSAMAQDKVVMKQIMESILLPVVPYTWFFEEEYFENKDKILKEIKKLSYPVIVKPASLGSSIGIEVVKSADDIDKAIISALKYDCKIVVEKMVDNLVEVNCSVMGDYAHQETSVLEEVMGANEYLTYVDKYVGNGKGKNTKGMLATNRIIPARLDKKQEKDVKELAKSTFRILNLSGVARIDFLIDKDKKEIFVNEPNTIPGSLAFYLWEASGKKYSDLLEDIITLAIKKFKKRSKKVYSFETNILSNFRGSKGLKGIKGKLK